MATPQRQSTIEISPLETRTITVAVRGTRPMILNRMSEKARRELLLPKGRKTAADKAANLKHNPLEEFRASPYVILDEDAPTYLAQLASCFKQAMMGAALRTPGGNKTAIGQLVYVENDLIPIYGVPELLMSVTRSADMNKTPDIRTRAIIPNWAAVLSITFTVPIITEQSVVNLLAAAGQINGIGDWRPQKGSGTYGQFVLTNADEDEAFQEVIATGGREAQQAAMESPVAYDTETEEMLTWFDDEVKRRGRAA